MAAKIDPTKRRVARRLLVAAGLASILCVSARAQQTEPGTLSDAIRFFAHEKSAAEQYGVILFTVAKDNAGLYARGIYLYADAKAEFDGLITKLQVDLKDEQDPARSVKFNEVLRKAAEKRVAFTSFVSDLVEKQKGTRPWLPQTRPELPKTQRGLPEAGPWLAETQRVGPLLNDAAADVSGISHLWIPRAWISCAGLPDVILTVPDLLKALTDANLSIYKEFRASHEERRRWILDELERLKWRPFSELTNP